MSTDLVERLRFLCIVTDEEKLKQIDALVTATLEQQAAEIARLQGQCDKLKTVMIAAAEEISAHWDAHCDAEGYGPVNLQRRLEEGIPSEYGYTAGAFASLRAERDALRMDAERWRYFVTHCEWRRHLPDDCRDPGYSMMFLRLPYDTDQSCVALRNAAIDAARAAREST